MLRAARAATRARDAWIASQAAAAELQPALDARLSEAWSVIAEIGKVNRELRYLSARIEELDGRVHALRAATQGAARCAGLD
jgi:hypothetical protein